MQPPTHAPARVLIGWGAYRVNTPKSGSAVALRPRRTAESREHTSAVACG